VRQVAGALRPQLARRQSGGLVGPGGHGAILAAFTRSGRNSEVRPHLRSPGVVFPVK
jgi:hypothetical protein